MATIFGIPIGGLATYFVTTMGFGWQVKMALILIPTLVYGAMFLRMRIPETERVTAGVSTAGMFREAFRPMFLVLAFAMLLTASTELGTNRWLPNYLTTTAAVSGILVLAYINGLMAIGRFLKLVSPLQHVPVLHEALRVIKNSDIVLTTFDMGNYIV
jgi:hypothetical protein